MKRISLLLLVSIVLTACASPTPATTETTIVVSTLAHKESPTPEATKTPAVTPTPKGPKEGQARLKEGVGEQVYQVIRDNEGNIMYAEWVRVKTPNGGIPIMDSETDQYLGYDQEGKILLVCSDRFDGCGSVPKFTYVDITSDNTNDMGVAARVSTIIKDRLNIAGKLFDYKVSHPNGLDFSFFLTDPENPFTWTMRPEPHSSVVEILTDWDDPIFEGGQEIDIDSYFSLRSKILGVDKDGRLIGVVAVNKFPPAGAEYIWNHVILLHSAMVLQQEDVLNIKEPTVLRDLVDNALIESSQGYPWVIMEPDN